MWRPTRERTIERCEAADAKQVTGTDVRGFVGLFKIAPDLRGNEFQTTSAANSDRVRCKALGSRLTGVTRVATIVPRQCQSPKKKGESTIKEYPPSNAPRKTPLHIAETTHTIFFHSKSGLFGWESSWGSSEDVGGTRRGVVSECSNRIAMDNGESLRDHGARGPEPQATGEEQTSLALLC